MKFSLAIASPQRGFTLLEVVVAMAIVGLGVVTLMELYSSGLRLTATGQAKTAAVAVAQQAMDGVLIESRLESGERDGSTPAGHRWRIRLAELPQGDGLVTQGGWELKEIILHLRYRDGAREKEIAMRTLRLVKASSR